MIDDSLSQWEDECKTQLDAEHENNAFLNFVLLANFLGYKRVAYGLEVPTSVIEPAFSFYSNFADDWRERFVGRGVRDYSSRVALGKRSGEAANEDSAYYWSKSDFQREISINGIELQFSEVSQGRAGSISHVGLADNEEALTVDLLKRTRILVDHAIEALERLLIEKHLPQAAIQLTDAERLYLLWVLEGKTAGEIATIMDLQLSHVETMQKRLPGRFGKKGAFSTAFLAFRLGLLNQG